MEISQIESFKKPTQAPIEATILKAWDTIKLTLFRVHIILNNNNSNSNEIISLIKEILTRAYILDKLFNPIEKKHDDWDFLLTSSQINWLNLWENHYQEDELEENEIYYHTPSIWIFFNWKPIFLNHNYVEALWATDEETLKQDIIDGIALEKYYEEDSVWVAKNAVSRLKKWDWYTNLILVTKKWKKISWNSFWSNDWLEVRIWNDITLWQFKNTSIQWLEQYDWITLNTEKIVRTFIEKVNHILNDDDKKRLEVFIYLSKVLDTIWNNWQFLMNTTEMLDPNYKMLFNWNYAKALKRTKDDIIQKSQNRKLWEVTYDSETLSELDDLMERLHNDWYYIHDFPMIDSEWRKKVYSWLRFIIEDFDFWIHRTFGIWNNTISKVTAELEKYYTK